MPQVLPSLDGLLTGGRNAWASWPSAVMSPCITICVTLQSASPRTQQLGVTALLAVATDIRTALK